MEVKIDATPVKEGEKKDTPDKWEIESWCRTLVEAEEIKADKDKMALVKPMMAKKAKAFSKISSLDDLREVANKKIKKEEE